MSTISEPETESDTEEEKEMSVGRRAGVAQPKMDKLFKNKDFPDTQNRDPVLKELLNKALAYKHKDKAEDADKDKELPSTFQIRPGLAEKFKPLTVKEVIHAVLNDELGGKVYSESDADTWTTGIANTIRNKVRDMGYKRYKFMVQVVIGEQHGAGVKIGSRCLWDADSDNYASDVFLNDTIFCMAVVFAIYFY